MIGDFDIVCFVLDATQPFGRGDQWVANLVPKDSVCIVNKADKASKPELAAMLAAAGELGLREYFPLSAKTGHGVTALIDPLTPPPPEGPQSLPAHPAPAVPPAFLDWQLA